MIRPIFFCKSWFRAKKRATEIWSEQQAMDAHRAKQLYSVLVDSPDNPFCFLEINEKFVGVGFLDENLRETLYYAFKEISPGTLFLGMATYREFEGETDKVSSGTTYIFSPDGSLKVQKQYFNPHFAEVSEANADVTGNYARWPEFGEYDEFLNVERIS